MRKPVPNYTLAVGVPSGALDRLRDRIEATRNDPGEYLILPTDAVVVPVQMTPKLTILEQRAAQAAKGEPPR